MSAFEELGVMVELTRALEEMEWLLPTEIQAEAIPLILGGGDILMASETGSGKTGAFCIPIVQVVYEQMLLARKSPSKRDSSVVSLDRRWTFSPVDRAPDIVLSNDLLTVQSKSGNWQGCRTNKGVKFIKNQACQSSRLYYEVFFAEQGLARLGWSVPNTALDLGIDRYGWGYGGTAKKSNNKQFLDYGQPFGEKFDIVGCILDIKSCELSFTKNGRNMGVAFTIPSNLLEQRGLFPTVCVKNAGCKIRLSRPAEKDDYKPENCIWISEVQETLIIKNNQFSISQTDEKGPLAIILEPSRELAIQTFDCLQTFSEGLGIKIFLSIGGTGETFDLIDIHILVCTPGRLSDAISKSQLPLSNVHFFILDEADGLLKQDNHRLIASVHSQLPKMFDTGRRLQTIFCSATLHNFEVKRLAQQLMYFPTWIDLKGEDCVPETVHHVVLRVNPKKDCEGGIKICFTTDGVHQEKDEYKLHNIHSSIEKGQTSKNRSPEEFSETIKVLKFYYVAEAIRKLKMESGVIFCRTKLDCDNLCDYLSLLSLREQSDMFDAVKLHSSLSQQERMSNLIKFKQKQTRFLICTDVAARGIDIKGVPFVIQVTLPEEKENYIHRIGRVGRADRMGLAISLVGTEYEKVWYHTCKKPQTCFNTRLVEKRGCCKWIHELTILAEIEEHLKCSIQELDKSFTLQVNEYDGKVTYGAKRLEQSATYAGHVEQLKSLVENLNDLELKAQTNYVKLYLSTAY